MDNDGRFPTKAWTRPATPLRRRGGGVRPVRVAAAPWLDHRAVGPDEWCVCIEVSEPGVLRDGRRAPRWMASQNLYYPCCVADSPAYGSG